MNDFFFHGDDFNVDERLRKLSEKVPTLFYSLTSECVKTKLNLKMSSGSKINVMTSVFPRSTKRFYLTINSVYLVNNAKEIQFSHSILYILQYLIDILQ